MAYGAQMTGWKFIYLFGLGRSMIMVHRPRSGIVSVGLLRQLVHSWYPIKDPARPRSPLCPSSWLAGNLSVIPYYTLHSQEGVILKSKIDAMMGLLWMPRGGRDVIHQASEDEISRFIYSWVETQRN